MVIVDYAGQVVYCDHKERNAEGDGLCLYLEGNTDPSADVVVFHRVLGKTIQDKVRVN